MKTLRDYQQQAMTGNCRYPGIIPALNEKASALCVMATGLGKTVVIAKVANEWTKGNVLCLAHRIELCDQMAKTLEGELGYLPSVEQGVRGMAPEDMFAAGQVVVGSIQSMITARRFRKFKDHPFGLIIIDEAHRATSPSYVKLIDQYRNLDPHMKILGVTATPNRTDGTALGLVFQAEAFNMGITDGIDAGWLVDIHQQFAICEQLDLSKIPLVTNEFGERDFKQSDLADLLEEEGQLHAMSRPVLDSTTNGQQAIIFTASVQHAHQWAAVLNHYRPKCAAAIDGTMQNLPGSERRHIVNSYKAGELQFLLNYGIAVEGFDAPTTAFVIMGRPTKSVLVYTQMLGRCTRPLAGLVDGLPTPEERKDTIRSSSKPFATVIDFVGVSKMGVVTATDVLGGNYDVNVRDAADEIIGSQRSQNARDALVKARAALLLEEEEKRRMPMRKAIQQAKVEYRISEMGNFTGHNGDGMITQERGGATDAQIAALVNLGVDRKTALGYSRRQAWAVMDSVRRKRCTIKQASTLKKFGYNPDEFNADSAHEQIQAIADNGWRRP